MRHKKRREGVELETGALNDIMFFLFLFFLMTASVAMPSMLKVSLPKSGKTEKALNVNSYDLYVLPSDSVNFNKKYYPVDHKDFTSFAKVEDDIIKLNDEAKLKNPNKEDKTKVAGITINVVADSRVNVQQLVNVMRLGADNGIKMVLITQVDKKAKK